MKRIFVDGWVLFGLALLQLILTFLFVTIVPLCYLVNRSHSDEGIRTELEVLAKFAEDEKNVELQGPEILEEMGPTIRSLVQSVPWLMVCFSASFLIYPFLGWWSAKLLNYPQGGGLLILSSVFSQQNICMLPMKLNFWNIAPVRLNLGWVSVLIVTQFALLTAGLLSQRGQKLIKTMKTKGEDK